jgi:hypothetical protein
MRIAPGNVNALRPGAADLAAGRQRTYPSARYGGGQSVHRVKAAPRLTCLDSPASRR